MRRGIGNFLGRGQSRISITNLAERHLRPFFPASFSSRPEQATISITNLAERHLRLRVAGDLCVAVDPHINHESSRKAFETGRRLRHLLSPSIIISITNLAERHLRLPRPQRHMPSRSCPISITNLAERHLRPLRTRPSLPTCACRRYQSRI